MTAWMRGVRGKWKSNRTPGDLWLDRGRNWNGTTEAERIGRQRLRQSTSETSATPSGHIKQAGGAFTRTAVLSLLLSIRTPDLTEGPRHLINIQNTSVNGGRVNGGCRTESTKSTD